MLGLALQVSATRTFGTRPQWSGFFEGARSAPSRSCRSCCPQRFAPELSFLLPAAIRAGGKPAPIAVAETGTVSRLTRSCLHNRDEPRQAALLAQGRGDVAEHARTRASDGSARGEPEAALLARTRNMSPFY